MTSTNAQFYARGKLLLTGEYAVLDGARALALPTHFGQHLSAGYWPEAGVLRWESFNQDFGLWFEATLSLHDLSIRNTSETTLARTLQSILKHIRQFEPAFLRRRQGVHVKTRLEFDRSWGLGSSSTLISCLARWAGIDAYALQQVAFGGSGYDIACATAEGPIFFQSSDDFRVVRPAQFMPVYSEHLYFVHLGKKQDSRAGISAWKAAGKVPPSTISRISEISRALCETVAAEECSKLLLEHEQLIGNHIGLRRAQEEHFEDFPGTVKSLGAWGGDFVLAVSPWDASKTKTYFLEKGFQTFLPYHEMVL